MEKPSSPAPAPRRDRAEYLRALRQMLLLKVTVSKTEGSLLFRAVLLQNTWGTWNLTKGLGRRGARVRTDEGRDGARKAQGAPAECSTLASCFWPFQVRTAPAGPGPAHRRVLQLCDEPLCRWVGGSGVLLLTTPALPVLQRIPERRNSALSI